MTYLCIELTAQEGPTKLSSLICVAKIRRDLPALKMAMQCSCACLVGLVSCRTEEGFGKGACTVCTYTGPTQSYALLVAMMLMLQPR